MKQFVVNIAQTGSTFKFGRVFRPKRVEVLYCLHKLYQLDVDPDFHLEDFEACCDPLLGSRYMKKWAKRLVALSDVEFVVEPDTIDPETKQKVYGESYWVWNTELAPVHLAPVWVLMCYSYFYDTSPTRSPRPGMHKKFVKGMGRVKTKGTYVCPHCSMRFKAVRAKDDSERYIDFLVWLTKHGEEYHGWGQFGPRLHKALKAGHVDEEVEIIDLFGKKAPSKAELKKARLRAMRQYTDTGATNVDPQPQPKSEVNPLPTLESKETKTHDETEPIGPTYVHTPPQDEPEGSDQVRRIYDQIIGQAEDQETQE